MHKKIISAFLFAMLFSSAFALSLGVSQEAEKGGTLFITGNALPEELGIKIVAGEWKITEKKIIPGQDGNFAFDYNIGFLDPSGEWKITASQKGEGETKAVEIKNAEESAFLFVKISSPAKQSFAATEKISFGAKITDSGKEVENANVFLWVPGNEKIPLRETARGIYSGEITIPVSVQPGDYNFFITAQKTFVDGRVYGGEKILEAKIERPTINAKVLRPTLLETMVEKPIEIVILPEYGTGAPVETAKIVAEVKNQKIGFQKTEEGFVASYTPSEEEIGSLEINVFVSDSFGNSNREKIILKVTGFEENFLQKNIVWLVLLAIAIVVAAAFAGFYYKKHRLAKDTTGRKKDLQLRIKQIENDFYKKGSTDRKTFEETMARYRDELHEIEKKSG